MIVPAAMRKASLAGNATLPTAAPKPLLFSSQGVGREASVVRKRTVEERDGTAVDIADFGIKKNLFFSPTVVAIEQKPFLWRITEKLMSFSGLVRKIKP